MMNVTGVELAVGQRLEVRIIDEAQEKAELKQKNDQFLRQLIQELIDQALDTDSQIDEDEDQDDDLEDDQDDDTEWNSWFEPLIEEPEPFIFNFTKNRYRSIEKEIPYLYRYEKPNTEAQEYEERIRSWRLLDPKRYQDFQAHAHDSVDHWDHTGFNIGDRVQIHYFLDDAPGYAYLKGKTGVIVGKSNRTLSYVQVKFEGIDRVQNVIPGNLERLTNDNKLPSVIDPELIITERFSYGWTAYVAGHKTTWEFGESKNEAIHKLLQTWYWNIKNR